MTDCEGLGNGSCGCGDGEGGGAGDVTTAGFVTSVARATTVSAADGEEGEERGGVASDGLWVEAASVSGVGVGMGHFKKSVCPRRRENSSSAIEL